ncbi:MAG: Omp28 family outer membrane lipoprotein [Bacteroidaceae bacterium]|nr:Omp28 family outer membrane lipoprotein [Bacteroidaceae bacterium]
MRKAIICLTAIIGLFFSCDEIDESERLIYVKPANVSKNVLLMDFTGQRCANCPTATEMLESVQQQYGADTVIVVSIHSGPLGFKGSNSAVGLATDLGDEYYEKWGIEYQPQGVVDYLEKADYITWPAIIRKHLECETDVQLQIESTYDKVEEKASIEVEAMSIDGQVDGNLQLWIIEDSITALQVMPDGTANAAYIHNSVFRETLNGSEGEPISLTEGETCVKKYNFNMKENWNADNISVVAFVYTSEGVRQVIRKKILKEI